MRLDSIAIILLIFIVGCSTTGSQEVKKTMSWNKYDDQFSLLLPDSPKKGTIIPFELKIKSRKNLRKITTLSCQPGDCMLTILDSTHYEITSHQDSCLIMLNTRNADEAETVVIKLGYLHFQ